MSRALQRSGRTARAAAFVWSAAGTAAFAAAAITVLLGLVVTVPALALRWPAAVVVSGSMAPGLNPGDVVIARPHDGVDLRPGTVVVFADPGRGGEWVTHRIVAVEPDGTYRTKGDANAAVDSAPLPPSRVVGTGVVAVPSIGLPSLWAMQGRWHRVVVVAAGFMALLWLARRPRRAGMDEVTP